MVNVISHQGVIQGKDDSHVYVRIIQTSACSSCSIKGHCSAAESKEKVIEIANHDKNYQVGDEVEIYGETSMGMKAVLLAFVVPFLVIVISLFGFMSITGGNELQSAAMALLLLIIYYIILARNKKQLKKEFTFKIKSLNN